MKIFNIDGINVEINDNLFREACRIYVLEDENNMYVSDTVEECRRSNYLHIKSLIIASYTNKLEDLGEVSFEEIKKKYSSKEISKKIEPLLRMDIKINGGNYDIT